MYLRGFFLLFFGCIVLSTGFSQELQNIKAEFDGEKVIISYDLVADNPGQFFQIVVFGSQDDFSDRLTNVIGDVGKKVKPGTGKEITWYAKSELSRNFNDDIRFKIIASLEKITQPLVVLYPSDLDNVKLGKRVEIKWEGGDPEETYRIGLNKGDRELLRIGAVSNAQSFEWDVHKSIAKGEEYQIRITNSQDNSESADGGKFRVSKKFPLYLVAIPVVVGAGVAALLGGGGDPPGGAEELSELPAPIDPAD